jgi:hypothetical protein
MYLTSTVLAIPIFQHRTYQSSSLDTDTCLFVNSFIYLLIIVDSSASSVRAWQKFRPCRSGDTSSQLPYLDTHRGPHSLLLGEQKAISLFAGKAPGEIGYHTHPSRVNGYNSISTFRNAFIMWCSGTGKMLYFLRLHIYLILSYKLERSEHHSPFLYKLGNFSDTAPWWVAS